MDEIKVTLGKIENTLRTLVEQLSAIQEDVKKFIGGVIPIESDDENLKLVAIQPRPLARPRNEYELKEIARLPDSVKLLRTFDGQVERYFSWVNRAQSIIDDYEIIKEKPLFRSIVLHIRQKIVGNADIVLCSYDIEDDNWPEIKRILALHYADKRDISTLHLQLYQLSRGPKTVEEFYLEVNKYLSLLMNSLKSRDEFKNAMNVLIEQYRHKALDVFIRGLDGKVARLMIVRNPKDLPEAFAFYLELEDVWERGNKRNKNALH